MPEYLSKCPYCHQPYHHGSINPSLMLHHGGVNPAVLAEAAKIGKEAISSIGSEVQRGVQTQHEFNKENLRLASEKAKVFSDYYRDLAHRRYHNPESLPPSLRLKKFGIDPPKAIFDPKNEAKRERADEALYEYAEKQIEKMQAGIKGKGLFYSQYYGSYEKPPAYHYESSSDEEPEYESSEDEELSEYTEY